MKKSVRIILLLLTLSLFCLFAIGSNSTDDSKESEASGEVTSSSNESYEVGDGSIETWTDSIGSSWVKVAVPVKNTGESNLYLSSCTIEIEDTSGSLVQTIDMVSAYPQIIKPGETAYYFEETSFDGDQNAELTLLPHVQVEKATVDCVRYDISEIQVKDNEYNSATVTGRVENTSSEAGNTVYVVANLFDNDGNFICNEFTILDNELPAGDKIGFETSSFAYDFSSSDVGSYEVYAYPNQYQF